MQNWFTINKEYVLRNIEEKKRQRAEELWMSLKEYEKIRKKNNWQAKLQWWISKVPSNKRKPVEIIGITNKARYEGWIMKLNVVDKNIEIQALITKWAKKPVILWDLELLSSVERKNVNRKVYWYFSSVQKSS